MISLQTDGKIVVAGSANNDFALARYNNEEVLAAGIINLQAYTVGTDVKIVWSALNELDVSQYNIERSVDGKNFIRVGNVPPLNNGQSKTEYSYIDFLPVGGDNLYRIKSISKDAPIKYTNTVKANFAGKASSMVLSPNPARNILRIDGLSSSPKTISVLDATGKL